MKDSLQGRAKPQESPFLWLHGTGKAARGAPQEKTKSFLCLQKTSRGHTLRLIGILFPALEIKIPGIDPTINQELS
jgi:hypothetical protein